MKHPGIVFKYGQDQLANCESLFTLTYAQDLRKEPSCETVNYLDPLRETVLLPGEPLSLIEEKGPYACVKAWWQPRWNGQLNCFEPYEGWTLKEALTRLDTEANWKMVSSHQACMRLEPSFESPSLGYLPMAALYVEKSPNDERAWDEPVWHCLEIEGHIYFVHDKDLCEWNWLEDCFSDVLRWQWRQGASRMKGLKYILGGLRLEDNPRSCSKSMCGVDCSGMLHLSARRMGKIIPRDSKDQYRFFDPIEATDLEVGDLIFLGMGSTCNINHVILQEEGGDWLESSRHYGGVVLHASESRKVNVEESMWMASVSKLMESQGLNEPDMAELDLRGE